jgi:excisionase family DNA binding protein
LDHPLLTPEEAAELLSVSAADVISLIENGDLAGLQIAGHWRITFDSIKDFVASGLRKQNVKALERAFLDHSKWARIIEEDPAFARSIEDGTFELGTMGAFLKEALLVSRASKIENVIPIRGKSDDNADS